jgi:hypothetical protein
LSRAFSTNGLSLSPSQSKDAEWTFLAAGCLNMIKSIFMFKAEAGMWFEEGTGSPPEILTQRHFSYSSRCLTAPLPKGAK